LDVYNKIYSRISSDFYVERSGDRSVMMFAPSANSSSSMNSTTASVQYLSHITTSSTEFFSKLREGIIISFQHRSSLYDLDIRRIESFRGTPTFDFKQLFLVKESLALLYQMMQLSELAYVQYEELELLIDSIPKESFPQNEWPMVLSEPFKAAGSSNNNSSNNIGENLPVDSNSTSSGGNRDCMSDAVKNGEEITTYSINMARMKILKNRLSFWELKRYVFSRQLFFLVALKKPAHCAQKSLKFLHSVISSLESKYRINKNSSSGSNGSTAVDSASEDGKSQAMKESSPLLLRQKQLEVWALTSSLRILRVCRDLSEKICFPQNNTKQSSDLQTPSQQTINSLLSSVQSSVSNSNLTRSVSTSLPVSSSSIMSSRSFTFSEQFGDLMNDPNFSSASPDKSQVLKEAFPAFHEIISFAMNRFNRLTFVMKYSKAHSSSLISSTIHSHLTDPSLKDSNGKHPEDSDNSHSSNFSALEHISVSSAQAKFYFSHYYDFEKNSTTSTTDILSKDLTDSKFDQETSLEQVGDCLFLSLCCFLMSAFHSH
jgi:hypothetical protein